MIYEYEVTEYRLMTKEDYLQMPLHFLTHLKREGFTAHYDAKNDMYILTR